MIRVFVEIVANLFTKSILLIRAMEEVQRNVYMYYNFGYASTSSTAVGHKCPFYHCEISVSRKRGLTRNDGIFGHTFVRTFASFEERNMEILFIIIQIYPTCNISHDSKKYDRALNCLT